MSSDEVFKQAVNWYSRCTCAKSRPTWHPTRLIDLKNLKVRVKLEGARTILKGRLGWETLDNEVVRLVEKGDDGFPCPGEPPQVAEDDLADDGGAGDHGTNPQHPYKNHNRYVTLSHCWGKHRPKILDSSSKAELRQGIKLKDLPTTYKEAIQFAAQMEDVGWIWIDSLCIIQDDARDWTHESSDMRRVYKESFLNISATASRDSTEGLYRDRVPKALWEDEVNLKVDGIHGLSVENALTGVSGSSVSDCYTKPDTKQTKLFWLSAILKWFRPVSRLQPHETQEQIKEAREKLQGKPFSRQEGIRRCILIDVSHWDDLVNTAPVNIRAWVLQERLLAPRVLHFSNGQIAWECSEFEESEGYPAGVPKYLLRDDRILRKPLNKGLIPDEHGRELRKIRLRGAQDPDAHLGDIYAFELWSRIVEEYSKLSLTEGKDKLVALSGIAEFVATKVIGSEQSSAVYRAGLWDKYLASQLLWKVEPVFKPYSRVFEHPSRRPRDANGDLLYRAPSFSWASIDAQYGDGVTYGEVTDQDLLIEVHTGQDAVSINCKVPKNLYGEVKGGHVMIWAKLRNIRLLKGEKGRFYWLLQGRSDACPPEKIDELETEEHRNVYLDCPDDDGDQILDTDNVYCVPAALGSRTEDKDSKYIICLLLQHVAESDDRLKSFKEIDRRGVYRRIGLTKLSTWADKRAYQFIHEPLATDRDFPQRPFEYGKNGKGRSLICII